jgi:hypothetical protein
VHIPQQLPRNIENGARRSLMWDVEIVTTDGGNEVRNQRWSTPLRTWEIGYNNGSLTNADHATVERMFYQTEGGTHTFNWWDERGNNGAGEMVKVRFDADLQFTNTVGPYHHLDSFTIKEVRG